jgi:hypothetical protein
METVMFSLILTKFDIVQQVLIKIRTVAAELPHSDRQAGRKMGKYDETNSLFGGRDSSVGIATELRAGRSGDRIPLWSRFFSHVQTGPGAHPASCTMGTGFFPGVKRPGHGADHPPPSSAAAQNE